MNLKSRKKPDPKTKKLLTLENKRNNPPFQEKEHENFAILQKKDIFAPK